jgi:hypothetical protein
MAATTLKPPTMPMLELRYSPELAMAAWHGSTPAVRPIEEAERAMPFSKASWDDIQ